MQNNYCNWYPVSNLSRERTDVTDWASGSSTIVAVFITLPFYSDKLHITGVNPHFMFLLFSPLLFQSSYCSYSLNIMKCSEKIYLSRVEYGT
jgi:hypothetical protein